jgi:hypothetical protein
MGFGEWWSFVELTPEVKPDGVLYDMYGLTA